MKSIRHALAVSDVIASTTVPAPRTALFRFLEDLDNHCALTGDRVSIVCLEGPLGARTGATVKLRGPARVRRRAHICLTDCARPAWILGVAQLGRTAAQIRWDLEGKGSRTHVTLRATILRLSLLDRALLVFGGRRWLEALFVNALESLRGRFDPVATPAPGTSEGIRGLRRQAPRPVGAESEEFSVRA